MALRDWVLNVRRLATNATTATGSPRIHALVATVATVAVPANVETAWELAADSGVARRRAKAITLLDEEPSRRIAVVAEAPAPGESVGHVCTAVRGVAVGDIA